MKHDMRQDIQSVLFTEEQIAERVKELGAEITKDFEGKNPLVICVLRGSFAFASDLFRVIDTPAEIDFMAASSYGSGTVSSGNVKIKKDLDTNPAGRHLIVVEDILDTGRTLSSLLANLKMRGAASVSLCTFLDKPARRVTPVEVQYCGFSVPDEFLVGYGLDFNQQYRNLPYVGILKPEVYGG